MKNIFSEIYTEINKPDHKYFKLGLIVLIAFGAIIVFVLPLVLKLPAVHPFLDLTPGKDVGDAFNGIVSPFIALLAAFLTFLAFYIQFRANIQQRKQFEESLHTQREEQKEQERTWKAERFESRFFELLKLHKENVGEIVISNEKQGREAFLYFYLKLKDLYNSLKHTLNNYELIHHKKSSIKSENINLLTLSYYVFYYGLGSSQLSLILGEMHEDNLKLVKETYPGYGKANIQPGYDKWLDHYYRHLYITANFIVNRDPIYPELDEGNEKKRYMKILRAQLSNYEQLMLYYNALAWYPEEWREIFTRYKLIKNLPIPMADFDVSPLEFFKKEIEDYQQKGEVIFEYQEYF